MKKININIMFSVMALLAILSIGIGTTYAAPNGWSYISKYPKDCIAKVIAPDGASYTEPTGVGCIIEVVEKNGAVTPYTVSTYVNKTIPRTTYDARVTVTVTVFPPPYEKKYDEEKEKVKVVKPNPTPNQTVTVVTTAAPPVSQYNPITDKYPLPTATPTPQKTGCQAAICWNPGKIVNGLGAVGHDLWNGAMDIYHMFGRS